MSEIKAGIIGATGYTGSELVRLLIQHPHVTIELITSESRKGHFFSDIHPQFKGIADFTLQSAEDINKYNLDVVFLALPHGVSMEFVKKHILAPFKIIDLSADFRLNSIASYKEWYGIDHTFPEGLEKDVFGSPELNKQRISKASFISNPGCYVTSVILAYAPLIKNQIISTEHLIADSKSGVTGAGAKSKDNTHFPNINEDFKPYSLKKHRHTIEMQEVLEGISGGKISLLFTPHLLPIDRGIVTTAYSFPVAGVNESNLQTLYSDFYQDAPFVRIISEPPSVKQVRGSNYCDIMISYDSRTNTIITISAIDNLVKGASGQAIQNMNIMFGLPETTGLLYTPLKP